MPETNKNEIIVGTFEELWNKYKDFSLKELQKAQEQFIKEENPWKKSFAFSIIGHLIILRNKQNNSRKLKLGSEEWHESLMEIAQIEAIWEDLMAKFIKSEKYLYEILGTKVLETVEEIFERLLLLPTMELQNSNDIVTQLPNELGNTEKSWWGCIVNQLWISKSAKQTNGDCRDNPEIRIALQKCKEIRESKKLPQQPSSNHNEGGGVKEPVGVNSFYFSFIENRKDFSR